MNWIRHVWGRVWEDLRAGKNIELYVLVALAATLIVLNVFSLTSPSSLAAATLAVLTLLGIALLRIRHQIESLERSTSALSSSRSVAAQLFRPEDNLDEIQDAIRNARIIWLWGATLSQHLPILAGLIGECMDRNGLEVRILLLKEAGGGMNMAVFRAGGNATAAALTSDLRANIERLKRDAATRTRGGLELRTVDYIAPYTLYAYDPIVSSGTTWSANPAGRIEMRLTSFRGSHYRRPTFALSGSVDGDWYLHFCDEFQKVWSVADPA